MAQCYDVWHVCTHSMVGSLRYREVACSTSNRQGSNFESCVWRTVSSHLSHQWHHPQEVLLAQFSLYEYVHKAKGDLKPDSFLTSVSVPKIQTTPPVIGENFEFSCIFLNKVKLTPLFQPKCCGLRPLVLHILDPPLLLHILDPPLLTENKEGKAQSTQQTQGVGPSVGLTLAHRLRRWRCPKVSLTKFKLSTAGICGGGFYRRLTARHPRRRTAPIKL